MRPFHVQLVLITLLGYAQVMAWGAAPDPLSAKTLATTCRVPPYTSCLSYLRGALEMRRQLADTGVETQLVFCVPSLAPEQRRDIFLKWIKANPKSVHWSASRAIQRAFSEAFPCSED